MYKFIKSFLHIILVVFFSSTLCVNLEQDMESKNQDHQQEVERLQQDSQLDKEKLRHESQLKKEIKDVGGMLLWCLDCTILMQLLYS